MGGGGIGVDRDGSGSDGGEFSFGPSRGGGGWLGSLEAMGGAGSRSSVTTTLALTTPSRHALRRPEVLNLAVVPRCFVPLDESSSSSSICGSGGHGGQCSAPEGGVC